MLCHCHGPKIKAPVSRPFSDGGFCGSMIRLLNYLKAYAELTLFGIPIGAKEVEVAYL